MDLWISGEILDLSHEGEAIHKHLRPSNKPSTVAEFSKKFTREMLPTLREKCPNTEFFLVRIFLYSDQKQLHIGTLFTYYNAMKLLTDNMQNGILPLNQKTLNQLKQKHPQGKEAELDVLLTDNPNKYI